MKYFRPISLVLFCAFLSVANAFSSEYHCDADCQNDLKRSQSVAEELSRSPDQIIGIELIVAAGSNTALESHWGHALLRFVSWANSWAQDYVLEFVANVNESKASIRKGLTGGYASIPEFDSMKSDRQEYVTEEKRDLMRVIIPTSPEMRAKVVQTLLKWITHPAENFKNYTFLDNNCGGMMTRFLQDAELPYEGIRARIPSHIPRYLEKLLLNPYPELVIENEDVQKVPTELYQLCSDEACISRISEIEQSLWSSEQLVKARHDRQKIAEKELSHLPKSVAALPDLVAHFELLLKYDTN